MVCWREDTESLGPYGKTCTGQVRLGAAGMALGWVGLVIGCVVIVYVELWNNVSNAKVGFSKLTRFTNS